MKLKFRLMEFQRQLVGGALPEQRPQLALMLGWALNFCLGVILALVPVFCYAGHQAR